MEFDFTALRETLLDWPAEVPSKISQDGLLERIRQVLLFIQAHNHGCEDLLPLLRQALLREKSRTGKEMLLRVPIGGPWPNAALWETRGFTVAHINDNYLMINANEWRPGWLDYSSGGVFADAISEKKVRRRTELDADPFISDATGYSFYSCHGQQEAVRAAFLMPPGDTLIVNLPTGSGKSLVAQAPALRATEGDLMLFVVPTTSLAFDQARQMRQMLKQQGKSDRPMVWYGGLSGEERQAIRAAIGNGSQRILFTSPEALTRSLLSSVFQAAKAGMLRYLVMDEAHLVSQWGDSFRPAFQTLAGLRRGLLRVSGDRPFRTLLLSATLTEETIETLANMFGAEGHTHLVSAVHLRPEPQYWINRALTESAKIERVIEAIHHAPRPFILYVTRRDEAMKWNQILRKQGFKRISCFHGNTGDAERSRIINEWAGNQLDGIVATSAFGVGIDKSDVRTVLHATIPETLDRFYQEVGRGGRDGCSSASLLIYHSNERHQQDSMAAPTLISAELGINRWRALHNRARPIVGTDLIELDLDVVPEHGRQSSDYNDAWNMRTILMMERSGLLQIDLEPPPQHSTIADDVSTLDHQKIAVRILNDGHIKPETWESLVSPSRKLTKDTAQRNLQVLHKWISSELAICVALKQLYTVKSSLWRTDVVSVCGGCPDHRVPVDNLVAPYRIPYASPITQAVAINISPWTKKFPWLDPICTTVFYTRSELTSVTKFLEWLVGAVGFQEIASNELMAVSDGRRLAHLHKRAVGGVLIQRALYDIHDYEPYTPLARISVFCGEEPPAVIDHVYSLQRPYHIILIPADTQDSHNSKRLLRDVQSNSTSLEQIMPMLLS
jgi:superfamily II DNA/RNA helicase